MTVAICTRNRPIALQQCLTILQSQLEPSIELLVVDSAPSTPAAAAIAKAAKANYVVCDRPGLDVARNMALRLAQGQIIVFTDDDVVPAAGWLATLQASFEDPTVACVTGRVRPLELRTPWQRYFEEHFSFDRGPEPIRFTRTDRRPWYPLYPYHLGSGCNMAFRRDVFDTIGAFDEALDAGTLIGGGGDIDIFRRLLQAGFVAVYNPDALVYHQHRVEAAESRRQFWAYGKTFTALLTKIFLTERGVKGQALSLFVYRFWQQGRWLARRLIKGTGLPLHLILLETMGHLAGPLLFWLARRRVQKNQLNYLPPAQVQSLDISNGLPAAVEVAANHDLYLLIKKQGRPQGAILWENPGPIIEQERLRQRLNQLETQPLTFSPVSALAEQVSIIICTRNRPEPLRNCLESLRKQQGAQYEIVVVDNGSGPATAEVAAQYPVRLIREEQVGLCRARNRGLAEARGQIVAFIDDDVVVDPGWLAGLVSGFANPTVGGVIGLVLPLELRTPSQRLFEKLGGLGRGFKRRLYHYSLPATPAGDIGVGANMAFRHEALLKHGPFDEALDVGTPTQAGGDIDIFYRLLRGGETILYEPVMMAWHHHRAGAGELHRLRYRYSMGAAAAFTRWTLNGDLAALRLGLGWFFNHHLRELAISLLGSHLLPPSVILSGAWGALLGPLAYLHSRWQTRRRQPVQVSLEQKSNWQGAQENGLYPKIIGQEETAEV